VCHVSAIEQKTLHKIKKLRVGNAGVTGASRESVSDWPRTTQNTHGQEKHCREQSENAAHGDADDAKGYGQQPYDGIEHQREQCDGPAQDEQDAPEEKGSHDFLHHDRVHYQVRAPEAKSFLRAPERSRMGFLLERC
jgi:hypothetical protein